MTDQLLGRKNKIVVLCYHTVSDSNWVFDTELKDLEKQMKYMLTKYKPISMSDLLLFLNGKKVIDTPSFVVNFDDGYKSIMKSRSMFFKFNIKPIVFLIANKKRVDRKELNNKNELLGRNDIKLLRKSGWEIGGHSMTHRLLDNCNNPELLYEVEKSKAVLEKSTKHKIDYFSYPQGAYSNRVLKQVEGAGYKLAVSMDDDLINSKTNRFVVPRIGVNATLSFAEFKYSISPSVVWFRGFIKKYIYKKFI